MTINNDEKRIRNWINSGEFSTDISNALTEISKKAISAQNESQTADAFQNTLYSLIKNKTNKEIDFSRETPIGNIVHKFGSQSRASGRGRLDAVINNLVIEYKHYTKLKTKKQIIAACQQVRDYLKALYTTVRIKYDAILTDGLKICYFKYEEDEIRYSSPAQLSINDIETIVKAIVNNEKKKFVPKNITRDFGIFCEISFGFPSSSQKLASELYKILKTGPTEKTKMLYEEWLSLLHLSIEDNGKSNDIDKRRGDLSRIFSDQIDDVDKECKALWALQTTYAIIVKLIACKAVDKLEFNENARSFLDLTNITSENLQKLFEQIEDGYSYQNSNVSNFLEGDFFSWYSDKKQWNVEIYTHILNIIRLVDEYTSFNFDFSYAPIDVFKDLYMCIIPKSIRHSMGEYFTPEWLADYVISEGLKKISNDNWKAIDPCCGSGIFIISLIKHIVGDVEIKNLSNEERVKLKKKITSRVFGIDINPLSVLSARVGYYLALQPFGPLQDVELPIYLGDSAIVPTKELVGDIECFKYSVTNEKHPFDVLLPARFVRDPDFGKTMNELQAYVKTNDSKILYEMLVSKFTEKEKKLLCDSVAQLADNLVLLHKNNWDGIWVRISTNFMLIARLADFDLIVGNPPWVKWEHLPTTYANKIKELCNIKHIFSNDGGQFGGTQLNICALISNVTATNWLNSGGVLAFLMPDSIMSQNSYEEYRNFYLDYSKKERLYLQGIDRWLAPLRPFRCEDKPVTQDFNTYYYSSNYVDYSAGIPVRIISRDEKIKDEYLNSFASFNKVWTSGLLKVSTGKAAQLSEKSTAFSYISSIYDYRKIIGKTDYQYRTGVEFTPQELYMLVGIGKSDKEGHYLFSNKQFLLSKYKIDNAPLSGWDLPTDYIYPIVTSTCLNNFSYTNRDEYCILPYKQNDIKKPISSIEMINTQKDLFNYLVNYKDLIDKQSEKSKAMHRGSEFYALSKIGNYTFAPHIVAARDNTRFCAAVINPAKTGWGEIKKSICVKHIIIISQDRENRYINENEAYYISGILNSDIVVNYMHDSFKKNGFSLNKSNLYIPMFNSSDQLHCQIANLARKGEVSTDIKPIQQKLTECYIRLCETRN